MCLRGASSRNPAIPVVTAETLIAARMVTLCSCCSNPIIIGVSENRGTLI